jgi:hypothetical protein
MSRTLLCLITAAGLTTASIALTIGRYRVLGDEVKVPIGPGTWKVTLLVQGKATAGDAKLMTTVPLDYGHQHILDEMCRSSEMIAKPPDARHPGRRQVTWVLRPGIPTGPFRARYQFYCTVNVHTPSSPMAKVARTIGAPPHPGEHLQSEPRIESEHPDITALARNLTTGIEDLRDLLDVLYRHVDQEIGNEPNIQGSGTSAVECLKNGSGDPGAKSRLLVALCRNRGIPARLVTGLTLRRGHEQSAHVWAEAWVHDHWLPACPFYHHIGRVPPSYLVFDYGDVQPARGRGVRDLSYGFLVERPVAADEAAGDFPGRLKRVLSRLSLYALPPTEQRLVEFLLLVPVAALIVCLFRNVIGLISFGTFAPALLGLAFRDLGSLPGILVFVTIVLIGWVMRRILNHYHLLQVPRVAFLLSLVVLILIGSIVSANYFDLPATKYVSLFPMVILTGMIERFWTLEVEDGASASFRTLLVTVIIAATISLLLSLHALVRYLFRFPETLGIVMAAQLLIGRYTGYRLSELFRFRDFLNQPVAPVPIGGSRS